MDVTNLNEIIKALDNKKVNMPCPRCDTNNFRIIGESEISVLQHESFRGLNTSGTYEPPNKNITLPIIIVTCENCGYVAQHAKAALDLPLKHTGRGLKTR